MAYILTFQADESVLCVRATGDRSSASPMAAAKDLWTQIALECEERALSRVLLLSEISGRLPTYDCYEAMSKLDEYGVSRTWKIAYVNSDPQRRDDLMFMTVLANHYGFSLKLFEREAEARDWLIREIARTGRHEEIRSAGVT